MPDYLDAILIALLGWWLSTGVILYLNLRPRSSHRYSVLAFAVIALVSLSLLPRVAALQTEAAAIGGFCLALGIWGFLEISYLMNFITGTHAEPCPAGARGWRRFRLALGTSIYHELSILLTGLSVIGLTWGAPNQVATGTFAVLWVMRWSAKLNLYLGVANFNEHWLPERNRYLVSYMRTRPLNFLFPFSVAGGTVVATLLLLSAMTADSAFGRLGNMLVCSLLSLAVLEHWFLVLPIRDSALWQWAIEAARRANDSSAQQAREHEAEVLTARTSASAAAIVAVAAAGNGKATHLDAARRGGRAS